MSTSDGNGGNGNGGNGNGGNRGGGGHSQSNNGSVSGNHHISGQPNFPSCAHQSHSGRVKSNTHGSTKKKGDKKERKIGAKKKTKVMRKKVKGPKKLLPIA